jgi:hypothetical protein
MLALASTVILRSDSRRTRDHILLSQIRDSPNPEGQIPVFISPRNLVAQLYPQALGSRFVASYDSQGYGGGIRPSLHTGETRQSKSKLLYDWRFTAQSVCLGVKPLETHDQRFFSPN